MNNQIYIRRSNKVVLEPSEDAKLPQQYLATMIKNLEDLGYTFSSDLVERISTLTVSRATKFYKKTVSNLKKMVGANVVHKPMYVNFPKQVMEISDARMYMDQMMHYIGDVLGVRIMPEHEKEERFPLIDNIDLKVIDLGDIDDFNSIFTKLVSSKTSISETDKEDISWFIQNYGDRIMPIMPEEITHKEVLSYVTNLLLNEYADVFNNVFDVIPAYYKTATDVLRLAVSMSDGDVSLASNTKFRNFKRSERKMFLMALNNCKNITEDMSKYKEKWKRLSYKIHPFENKQISKRTRNAFDVILNNKKVSTFNSNLEAYLLIGDIGNATILLKSRPGELARRLDQLIRNTNKKSKVIETFKSVASQVATPVLLQVMSHFGSRNVKSEYRTIMPKGNIAKIKLLDNHIGPLDMNTCHSIVTVCEEALKERFKALPSLGKIFLDERMKNYLVPFSQRSASKSLRPAVRGSRFPLEEGKDVVRFFIHWKGSRVDLDLSAVIFDSKWNMKDQISYTSLRSEKYKGYHSGDITTAPRGASEFIDLDIPIALKNGARYIMMNVYSYTGQPFNEVKECFAGWMLREECQSGEIFEAKTVQDKLDLTNDGKICVPLIIDLKTREVIWADLIKKGRDYMPNNVESNLSGIVAMGMAITTMKKTNLHDLFRLHSEARGELVDNIEEAETIFAEDSGFSSSFSSLITPFDLETIMSEFLT